MDRSNATACAKCRQDHVHDRDMSDTNLCPAFKLCPAQLSTMENEMSYVPYTYKRSFSLKRNQHISARITSPIDSSLNLNTHIYTHNMHPVYKLEHVIYQLCGCLSLSAFNTLTSISSVVQQRAMGKLYKMVNLQEAVSPLGNVEEVDDCYQFVYLDTQRWPQFTGCAQYVQVLTANPEKHQHLMQVLFKMGFKRGIRHLFPKTRYLEWTTGSDAGLDDIYMFIPPHLTHLSLRLQNLPSASFQKLCEYLTRNVKTLQVLQIDLPDQIQLPALSIQLFTSLLQFYAATLTFVCVPTALFTPLVAFILSRCPNLKEIIIGFSPDILDDMPFLRKFLIDFPPEIESLKFLVNNDNDHTPSPRSRKGNQPSLASLRTLEFHGAQSALHEICFRNLNFTALTSFEWSVKKGMDINIALLVKTLVASSPQLGLLQLGDTRMFYPYKDNEVPIVPWSAIEPLLQCRTITMLAIHAVKIDMTFNELRSLLRSRHTWEVFEVYSAKPTNLPAILRYATRCRELWRLGVHLDISSDTDIGTLQLPANFRLLPSLTRVEIAYSNIQPDFKEKVAECLYGVSGKPVRVEGYDVDVCVAISNYIGGLYEKDERRTGQPMSDLVQSQINDTEEERRLTEDVDCSY